MHKNAYDDDDDYDDDDERISFIAAWSPNSQDCKLGRVQGRVKYTKRRVTQ